MNRFLKAIRLWLSGKREPSQAELNRARIELLWRNIAAINALNASFAAMSDDNYRRAMELEPRIDSEYVAREAAISELVGSATYGEEA